MSMIAIPTRAGQVDEHFGHCESFTIFTLDEAKNVTAEQSFAPPPDCGCKSNLVATLAEMGVRAVIAGNMGEGAARKLQQNGFTVVRGASGPVREALQAWLDGRLKNKIDLCQAHGHGHQCGHGHGAPLG